MSSTPHTHRSSEPAPAVIPFHERRRHVRRPVQSKATLVVLDGEATGQSYEVQMRNLSLGGICFLLRQSLSVGQTCRIDIPGPGGMVDSHICEVVRSRLLSNGKHEMAVQFRKPA